MSDDARNRELRMELLRMRASVERAELATALRGVRERTGRLRNLATMAGSVSAAVAGRSGWVGLLASTITGRPWLAALGLSALRALKRRPLLAVTVLSAAAALGLRAASRHGQVAAPPPVRGPFRR